MLEPGVAPRAARRPAGRHPMYDYGAILAFQARRVERAYPTQITDRSHPAHGAFLSETSGAHPNADHGANASLLASACFVLMADGSRLEGDAELFHRVQWSVAFQRRWQRPTGLIDLLSMNWESPPDTGFAVQLLAPAVDLARRLASQGNSQAQTIADSLGAFVRTAAAGMIDRGFHTPNHRWVVCSALAQAMTLFPEVEAGAYVERILTETVDINEDGEYTERSTGVYNAVCNRTAFAVRYGEVNLRSVKFSGSYLRSANFAADSMAAIAGGVRLEREGKAHPLPGYELPLGRPLPVGTVHAARSSRERWTLPAIDLRLEIREVASGFDLRYVTGGGLDRIPSRSSAPSPDRESGRRRTRSSRRMTA